MAGDGRLQRIWYGRERPGWILIGISRIYGALVRIRRHCYDRGWLATDRVQVPVVVVGNVTAGGTGKTPLVAWLCGRLRDAGLHPGVVSRGYGGRRWTRPHRVDTDDRAEEVGDEPLLLARRTGVPVVVCTDRVAAARSLGGEVDCIIADDGLQHLRLARDVEIAVVDHARRFGNGRLLPAGPLREPADRLDDVDFIVENGADMHLQSQGLRQVRRPDQPGELADLGQIRVHAVAGIGHPQRFFDLLESLGLEVLPHAFADHHRYRPEELAAFADAPVIMTEKDAVKCQAFAQDNWWYLPVSACVAEPLASRIVQRISQLPRKSGICPSSQAEHP